jgi:hypothetical protein
MSQRPFLPPLSFTPPVSFNLSQLGPPTRREKNIAFQVQNGKIGPVFEFQLISFKTVGVTGLTPVVPVLVAENAIHYFESNRDHEMVGQGQVFGKPTSEAFVSSFPILDLPTCRTKKGSCL